MKKIEIVAMMSDRKHILERLQRRGVVEITSVEDDDLVQVNTTSSISQFERALSTAQSALAVLDEYAKEKKSLLDSLNGRTELTTAQFADKLAKNQATLSECSKILAKRKKMTESENRISRLKTQIDTLNPWKDFGLAQNFSGTKQTTAFIGTLSGMYTTSELENQILSLRPEAICSVEIISSRKEQTNLMVVCHKSLTQTVLEALAELNFSPFQSKSNLTPAEEIAQCEKEIAECEKNREVLLKELVEFATVREDICFVIDYLSIRIQKYQALGRVSLTKNTFFIHGYVPQKYVKGLVSELESKYDVAISVTEPDESEEVPVLLQNSKFSQPVESITEMYALPNKRDVDPSSVMSFFYYLFFGMMLSDAGYGLVILIGTTIVLSKFRLEKSLRKSMKMFQYCGVSTVIWGALFGSWFGDLPQVVASIFGVTIDSTALWFEPLDDPIKLLLFSFGLGICHLFLGLAVNFRILWKEGKPIDAICEVVPIYLTILGAAPLGAGILSDVPEVLTKISPYILIVGVISIILTSSRSSKNVFMRFFGGIYGLYNVATGYLSDILSYSRLLALGLATGSIASVINLLCMMPENKVLQVIMLITLGVVGHVANIGINMLGAYVHSDRLQFVELFSKFYEGGGRAFEPLRSNTKYFKFKKENIYE